MSRRRITKLIHEGEFAAEIEVELLEDATGWSPYLAPDDAYKLDDTREALRNKELERAATMARVFRLEPVIQGSP